MEEPVLSEKTLKDVCFVRYYKNDKTIGISDGRHIRILFSDHDDKETVDTCHDALLVARLFARLSDRMIGCTKEDNGVIVWSLT